MLTKSGSFEQGYVDIKAIILNLGAYNSVVSMMPQIHLGHLFSLSIKAKPSILCLKNIVAQTPPPLNQILDSRQYSYFLFAREYPEK